MTRKDFEKYIEENNLQTVYLREKDCSDDYVSLAYCPKTDYIDAYGYGCVKNNDGTYHVSSQMLGDRGFDSGRIYSDSFDTEEKAFDELKKQVDYYRGYTAVHAYKDKVDSFLHAVAGKTIEPLCIHYVFRDIKFDVSFEEFDGMIKELFPDLLYSFDYDKEEMLLLTHEHFIVLKIKFDIYKVIYWEYDGEKYILFNKLESTFSDYITDENGIYVLYYNSDVLFTKYDYDGNVVYKVKPEHGIDLRYGLIHPKFFRTYRTFDGRYDSGEYIGVTNGSLSGVFNTEIGKMVEVAGMKTGNTEGDIK